MQPAKIVETTGYTLDVLCSECCGVSLAPLVLLYSGGWEAMVAVDMLVRGEFSI